MSKNKCAKHGIAGHIVGNHYPCGMGEKSRAKKSPKRKEGQPALPRLDY